MNQNQPIYIVAAKRTPIGSLGGSLSSLSAPKLAAPLIADVVSSYALPLESIEEAFLGCVLTAGVGQAPARQAVLAAGLTNTTQSITINKVCSSGLRAVALGAAQIRCGISELVIAGGMESMSNAPYLLPKLRSGARLGHTSSEDSIIRDGLWDVYNDYHMGSAAELCADKYSITREAQDAFAKESYKRTNAAIASGFFSKEILPISVSVGKETILVNTDEEPGKFQPEKLSKLNSVFKKDGTITAANASSISDGAAILLVASESAVKKFNLTPRARIVTWGAHGQAPEWFTTAPVGAIDRVIKQANITIEQVDLVEVNEAFSAVALAVQQLSGLDPTRLNITGGAVALGHPIGASGARILVTLLHNLERLGLKTGIAAICNGGGEATAMMIERV